MSYKQRFSDVDITYGAWFFEDQGDYANVIHVEDNGDDNETSVIVEYGSISVGTTNDVRQALAYTDYELHRSLPRDERRLNIWYSLAAYHGLEANYREVIQFDEGPPVFGASHVVHGEQGLRDYLDGKYDIEWDY